jgi:tRNA threonylcarbamoyl adenosine modification protein YeaZ
VIIAIDGAATDLSVALAEPSGAVIGETGWSSAQRQSAELLPRLLELLTSHGRRLDEATALAVGTGPGSFTGLRVAMALTKGFAVALGRPLVGVPSLAAWLAADPEVRAAVARAGAREAYVLMRGGDAPHIVDRDELADALGDAPVAAAVEVASAFELSAARSPVAAAAIARLAADRLRDDPAGDDPRLLEPIYLRAPRGVTSSTERGVVRWL